MIDIGDNSDMLDVWAVADSITTVAQAVCPSGVWELRYCGSGTFVLELNEHLGDELGCEACSQFYQQADYEGEGEHGSRFAITCDNGLSRLI